MCYDTKGGTVKHGGRGESIVPYLDLSKAVRPGLTPKRSSSCGWLSAKGFVLAPY